jgi:hypothetical protein
MACRGSVEGIDFGLNRARGGQGESRRTWHSTRFEGPENKCESQAVGELAARDRSAIWVAWPRCGPWAVHLSVQSQCALNACALFRFKVSVVGRRRGLLVEDLERWEESSDHLPPSGRFSVAEPIAICRLGEAVPLCVPKRTSSNLANSSRASTANKANTNSATPKSWVPTQGPQDRRRPHWNRVIRFRVGLVPSTTSLGHLFCGRGCRSARTTTAKIPDHAPGKSPSNPT